MKHKTFYLLLFIFFLSIIVTSCSLSEPCTEEDLTLPMKEESTDVRTIEEALTLLDNFMTEVCIDTKSEEKRKTGSVEIYYSPFSQKDHPVPEAYLVNFEDSAGFAVLRANTEGDPIIALTESGATTWDKLLNTTFESVRELDEGEESSISPDQMMSLCIRSALFGQSIEDQEEETKSGTYYNQVLPLTPSLKFEQIRTFCHKNNHSFVTAGCAAVALATIVAYHKYPKLRVDYKLIDYTKVNYYDGTGYWYFFDDGHELYIQPSDYFMNYHQIPANLSVAEMIALLPMISSNIYSNHTLYDDPIEDSPYKKTQYKLISGLYYILNNSFASWGGTGVLPANFKSGMEDLGYTNVSKTTTTSLTSTQISTIQTMLNNNKPVVMCGYTVVDPLNSHYWVIDGIRTTSDNKTHVHCNWGWGGDYNGWFLTDCLRKTEAVEYDSKSTNSGNSGNAWNNLVVFQYNKGTSTTTYSVSDFYQFHRATYQ